MKLRTWFVLVAMVAAGVFAEAQRGAPPAPVKEHTFDLESSYIRMPLAPGDEKYGRIDGARLKEHVKALTAIARKHHEAGEKYWGRLPGTKADAEAEQYVAAKFREFGLQNIEMQPVNLTPQWMASDFSLIATGSGTTLRPSSIYPAEKSVNTPAAGLNLEIVWVGYGSELDFAGRDVKGKLAFIRSDPRPNAFQGTARSNGSYQRAVDKGAAAVLINVNIPGNITNSFSPAKVPTFAIGTKDAEALEALMAKGPVTASLKLIAEERPGLVSHNVWGTLPGTSNEEVLILAHHDGLFEGAFDNASGVATMLGVAEYFAKVPQAQRKRTIKFVATAGQTDGGQGSSAILKERDTRLNNVVLVINSEHTSVAQMSSFGASGIFRTTATASPKRWWVNGSDKLASLAFDTYRTFGIALWDWEMYDGGGIGPFSRMTSLQLLDSPVYHSSSGDRDDIVPPAGLEASARAYAKIIDLIGSMTRAQLQQEAPAAAAPQTSSGGSGAVIYEGARLIIGPAASAPIANGAFVVQDGRITAIGARGTVTAPAGATHVDLTGKTVMPAMIDAHAHFGYEKYTKAEGDSRAEHYTPENLLDHLQRSAFYGIGSAHDGGTAVMPVSLQFQADQRAGKFPPAAQYSFNVGIVPTEGGPDEVLIKGTRPLHANFEVDRAVDARKAVQEIAAKGIGNIKVWIGDRNGSYPAMPHEVYEAVIDEAHKHGIKVHAHAMTLRDQKDIIRDGADLIVHIVANEKIDDELLALVKEKKPYWVPSIGTGIGNGLRHEVCEQDAFTTDLLPPHLLQEILASECKPNANAAAREAILRANFNAMIGAGARLVLGTDAGIRPSKTFGSADHHELTTYVRLGMSTADALDAATSKAADFLQLKDAGTLAVGRRADFLVLEANPLDEILNTRKISAVYLKGAKLDRNALLAKWKGSNASR